MELMRDHARLRRAVESLVAGAFVLTIGIALFPSTEARASDGAMAGLPREVPSCLRVASEARYRGLGYDHVVRITSACDEIARCTVATDVAPKPVEIIVPAQQSVEVVTFLGSPVSAFVPAVECTLILAAQAP